MVCLIMYDLLVVQSVKVFKSSILSEGLKLEITLVFKY